MGADTIAKLVVYGALVVAAFFGIQKLAMGYVNSYISDMNDATTNENNQRARLTKNLDAKTESGNEHALKEHIFIDTGHAVDK